MHKASSDKKLSIKMLTWDDVDQPSAIKTNLHVVQNFQESKRHSSSDYHLIHFFQKVFNQQDFVCDFGTKYIRAKK